MDTKTCFKCGEEKSVEEFYRHPQMKDGRLGKCKDCTRSDVTTSRRANPEHYSEYERKRFQTAERKAALYIYHLRARTTYPQKYKARNAVNNAIRDGRLTRQPCEVCGEFAEAHHEDYNKPFDVRWLCFKHHREIGHGQVVMAA